MIDFFHGSYMSAWLFIKLLLYCQISDDMKPHLVVVSALKVVCAVAPSWRIIPTPDILDKVCKDPDQMRKQMLPYTNCFVHHTVEITS